MQEPDLSFPVTVSMITPQKKNPNRFSLFSENGFLCGVSSDTLLKFHIHNGSVLTRDIFRRIAAEEELQKIKAYLLNLLSRRNHSTGELKQKALVKGLNMNLTDQVIGELCEKGYADDRHFAEIFAREKLRLNQWGPVKIKSELFKKNVKSVYIEDALNTLLESLDQKQICIDLILKKEKSFMRIKDTFKRKQKIISYLRQKGFTSESIRSATIDLSDKLDV
ncbi:MAG: regulatory protein RecX [Balneolaceae bacterium]